MFNKYIFFFSYKIQVLLLLSLLLLQKVNAQIRGRPRIRNNNLRHSSQEIMSRDNGNSDDYDEDSTPQPALQYYNTPQNQNEQNRVVLVTADHEFNGLYGQPTPSTRSRADFNRPNSNIPKSTSNTVRSKEVSSKDTIQTIRNYSKVNDDGSFTFGKLITKFSISEVLS